MILLRIVYFVKKSIGRGDCSLLACCHLVAASGMAQSLGGKRQLLLALYPAVTLALIHSGDSQCASSRPFPLSLLILFIF